MSNLTKSLDPDHKAIAKSNPNPIENYQEFKNYLKDDITLPHYYELLLTYSTEVLTDIALNNRTDVAKELNLSYQKLTHILPLLKAYVNLTKTKDNHRTIHEHQD